MFDYTSRKRKVGLVWGVFRKPGQGLRRTFSSILAICLVLVQVLSVLMGNFAIPAYAASSPWSQTDWSGGSGQTAWSVTNKYSSGSSVTTSTPNQVTLAQTSNWYNSSWTYRKKITLDNTASSSTLTNFPVLISLSSSNFTFSKAQSAGQDIRFTDSDGTTALSYQIEKWDNLNSQAWIWVKVPSLTATNYTIHMYYGNASASDGQSATSVWDSNTAAVWHLKELGNGTSG